MSCDSDNDRLYQSVLIQQVAYLMSSIIPVHERHVQVHQDQLIAAFTVHVHPQVLSDHLQRFLAVESYVTVLLSVDACSTAQDYQGGIYIEALVINDKDLSVCSV